MSMNAINISLKLVYNQMQRLLRRGYAMKYFSYMTSAKLEWKNE